MGKNKIILVVLLVLFLGISFGMHLTSTLIKLFSIDALILDKISLVTMLVVGITVAVIITRRGKKQQQS